MTTSYKIIDNHSQLFKKLLIKGRRNKIILLLLLIPAGLIAFKEFEDNYYRYELYKSLSYSNMILISFGIYLLLNLLVLTIKSSSFINKRSLIAYKKNYKQDFFSLAQMSSPEITAYKYRQKIHPKTFNDSGLFSKNYSDYKGDDWFGGIYKNSKFEICELHVFRLFKSIFSGLFIRCQISAYIPDTGTKQICNQLKEIIDFKNKYESEIRLSSIRTDLYIAISIKGQFFESDSLKQINQTEFNLKLINDTVTLLRAIINYFERR